jgi:prepilin-type processing-associated H-X9-DG protein
MNNQHAFQPVSRSAFSLLELIVVLGVLFLLAAILLPALSIAWQKTQSERCLNNLHQLTTAWLMYASVNNEQCANNFDEGGVIQELTAKTYRTWCLQLEDFSASASNTNTALLRVGQISPYVGVDLTHFKCPADTYLTAVQVKAGFQYRLRSYSMSGYFGLYTTNQGSAGPALQGRNVFTPNYRQFLKVSDTPEPSSFFLFLEENPYSINDGYYDFGTIPTKWIATTAGAFQDIPASYHNAGTSFSFADGHTEIHRWQDNVIPPPGQIISGSVADKPPYNDIHWMWEHSSVPF